MFQHDTGSPVSYKLPLDFVVMIVGWVIFLRFYYFSFIQYFVTPFRWPESTSMSTDVLWINTLSKFFISHRYLVNYWVMKTLEENRFSFSSSHIHFRGFTVECSNTILVNQHHNFLKNHSYNPSSSFITIIPYSLKILQRRYWWTNILKLWESLTSSMSD